METHFAIAKYNLRLKHLTTVQLQSKCKINLRRVVNVYCEWNAQHHVFKNKSTSGVQYPNTSADPLSFPSLCENGWSSRVVHHQETSVVKERQVRKREADREIAEAPPQSLAFSWRRAAEIKFRKLMAIGHFDDRVTWLSLTGNEGWPEGGRSDRTQAVGESSATSSCRTSLRRYVQRGSRSLFRWVFAKPIRPDRQVYQRIYLTSLGSIVIGENCLEQSQSACTTNINRLLSGICCITNILKHQIYIFNYPLKNVKPHALVVYSLQRETSWWWFWGKR